MKAQNNTLSQAVLIKKESHEWFKNKKKMTLEKKT